jgi:hypothetical protein
LTTDETRRHVILCLAAAAIGPNRRTAKQILGDIRGVVLPYDLPYMLLQHRGVSIDHPSAAKALHSFLNSLVGEVAGLKLLQDGRCFYVEGPQR